MPAGGLSLKFIRYVLFATATSLVGCTDSAEQPTQSADSSVSSAMSNETPDPVESDTPPGEEPVEPVEQLEHGSFNGVVRFEGELPAPRIIQTNKDPEVCSAGGGEVQDVIVRDGLLSGAVIEVTVKGDKLPDFVTPEDGFVLRQKDCRFSPRLLLAFDGATLTVHNDDRVEHNVNTGGWNLLQSPGSDPITEKVRYGGNPFTRVTCNIHGWMETWVYVARSPFCVISAEDGTFNIEGIPAGTKLRGTITHSALGKQRFKVDIVAGESTTQDFVFGNK